MASRTTNRQLALALMSSAALLALGLWAAAHALLRDRPSAPPAPPSPASASLAPVPRTRVLVIDGLSRAMASHLPTLVRLCRQGISLTIDVGFPTVSLPVQRVLWTGQRQQQSGVQLGNHPRLLAPAISSLPGSIAVAESHPSIAGSLGFSQVEVASVEGFDFAARAREASASDAPLVLVHLLAVDGAGHRHGAASAEYRAAAAAADRLLGKLLAVAPPSDELRWFVLSDHGHLARGGHGGAEPEIRLVRGCIAGDTPRQRGAVELVDVAHALAESTAVALPSGSHGRPLAIALAQPRPALPKAPLMPRVIALGLAAAALALMLHFVRRSPALVPLTALASVATIAAVQGAPSLSTKPWRVVLDPLGVVLLLAAILAGAALTHRADRRSRAAWRPVASAVVPVALAFAASALAGGALALFDETAAAPIPTWTAWAAALGIATITSQLSTAVALLWRGRRRPTRRSSTRR